MFRIIVLCSSKVSLPVGSFVVILKTDTGMKIHITVIFSNVDPLSNVKEF